MPAKKRRAESPRRPRTGRGRLRLRLDQRRRHPPRPLSREEEGLWNRGPSPMKGKARERRPNPKERSASAKGRRLQRQRLRRARRRRRPKTPSPRQTLTTSLHSRKKSCGRGRPAVRSGRADNIALWSESERPAGWVDPRFSRLSRDPLALRASPCGCGAAVEGSSAGDLAESGPPAAATPTIGADCGGCSATTAADGDAPSSGRRDRSTAHAVDGGRGAEGGRGDGEGAARSASAAGAATGAAAAGLGSLARGDDCACGAASFALGAREGTMARLLRGCTRRGARGGTRGEWPGGRAAEGRLRRRPGTAL